MREFNSLFKEIRARRGEQGIIESTWTNLALSAQGLQLLGAPGIEAFPSDFIQGMAAQAVTLGDVDVDVDDSDPQRWVPPFNAPQQIHALVNCVLSGIAPDDP